MYYSINQVVWDIFIKSCILPGWPSKVYPNWSTTKIPQGARTSSWYSKIVWHESPAYLDYQGSSNYEILNKSSPPIGQVLVRCYSLARDTKRVLFSLSILSSCRESPILLSIKEHLKLLTFHILDKSSPPDWTTKSMWAFLKQSISFGKETCTKLWLFNTLLVLFPLD